MTTALTCKRAVVRAKANRPRGPAKDIKKLLWLFLRLIVICMDRVY